MPLPRDLSATTEADIARFISDAVLESVYLDFKRELPGNDSASKHEFVADVSALSNAAGGEVIYGIEEDGAGQAQRVVPWTDNPDQVVRRLQDLLLHTVEPRLPGVQFQSVSVAGGWVLVVRVPRSWAGPHRVKTNQHFYIREGVRKRPLDVPEMRSLFLLTADQGRRVRDFRTDRLGLLLSGQGPVRLADYPLLVTHFVPTDAVLGSVAVDPTIYARSRQVPMLGTPSSSPRINIDGALRVEPGKQGEESYSLFFRSGFFESVACLRGMNPEESTFATLYHEEQLMLLLTAFRDELVSLGASKELVMLLSITRGNEVDLAVDRRLIGYSSNAPRFDRSVLVFPDVLLRGEDPPETALRPVFDLIWQAAGLLRSFNYDESGNRLRRQ